MPSETFSYQAFTCRGGINEQPEHAFPDQCAIAQDVWAPAGQVETRFGYVGVITLRAGGSATVTVFEARSEDVSGGTFGSPDGAGLLDLSALVAEQNGPFVAGDRWYLGHSAPFDIAQVGTTMVNVNATAFRVNYSNGTSFVPLRVTELQNAGSSQFPKTSPHLGAVLSNFSFPRPQDWALQTVDGQSAFWLQFEILGADFDATVEIDVDNGSTIVVTTFPVKGFFAPQFIENKRYLTLHVADGTTGIYGNNASIDQLDSVSSFRTTNPGIEIDQPATNAVISIFNESYIAYNGFVSIHKSEPDSGDDIVARVEDNPLIVGPDGFYDTDVYLLLQEVPPARYISYFRERLFVAGMTDEPHTVRWSEPSPFHKVWPGAFSFANLLDPDNSPITAMAPLSEHMAVYKQDSIWILIDAGLSSLGTQLYEPTKVVSGVGCVSSNSLAAVRGTHVFLGEDGIYQFDGTPKIRKITIDNRTGADRLAKTVDTISVNQRFKAAGVNWASQRVYLLAVSTTGLPEHDTVIVWDYDHDTFWTWTNIDAQHWLLDEQAGNNEVLYFGDSAGRVYQLGVGATDHGGTINPIVQTQRFGMHDPHTYRVGPVYVLANNKARELTVSFEPDDLNPNLVSSVLGIEGVIDFTDPIEVDWGALQWDPTGSAPQDNWTPESRRRRKQEFAQDADWFQVTVKSTQKNQRMKISAIHVGYKKLAAR